MSPSVGTSLFPRRIRGVDRYPGAYGGIGRTRGPGVGSVSGGARCGECGR